MGRCPAFNLSLSWQKCLGGFWAGGAAQTDGLALTRKKTNDSPRLTLRRCEGRACSG